MRTRDGQKGKLYAAEAEAFADCYERLETVEACQKFLDHLMRSAWFRRHFSVDQHIRVTDGRGRRYAGYQHGFFEGKVKLPLWARTKWVALHELCHGITRDNPHHGRKFARTFLMLVKHCLGKDVHDRLRASFRAHHVKWYPKRGPTGRTASAAFLAARRKREEEK